MKGRKEKCWLDNFKSPLFDTFFSHRERKSGEQFSRIKKKVAFSSSFQLPPLLLSGSSYLWIVVLLALQAPFFKSAISD